ncbi:hypothetical protein M0N77_03095 [Psychrobacter sp. AH5]|uniref:hypothetical protein n=1 Tax=Psychrobacter sp. AH5 TaxID=2937433 RepID=UPI0033427B0D
MTNIEPIMDGDIVPATMAAGIELGISFDFFKRHTRNILKKTKEECSTDYTNNFWFIFRRNELTIGGFYINDIYCYWDDNVVLEFSGDIPILTAIHVSNKYSGKLFNVLTIGSRLDLLKSKLGFGFYYGPGDVHYLLSSLSKPDEIVEGVFIRTNYLLPYSEEYQEQLVETITVYL